MTKRFVLWTGVLAGVWCAVAAAPAALPDRSAGTFVQRKTLADVGVTLVSRGTYVFEKDRSFVWRTVSPVPSEFHATPTNWSFTANGRTSVHPLAVDVSSIGHVFTVKEVKEYVRSVETEPKEGFPTRVNVRFRNGDRLAIELVPSGETR